jgi:hypothetical protein
MVLNKSRILLSLLSLTAISTNVFADEDDGWQFAVEGLYAQQSNNLPILYGFTPLITTNNTNAYQELGDALFPDPEGSFGFGAEIGYLFSEAYDIQLRYFGIWSDADANGTLSEFGAPPPSEPFYYYTDEEFNLNTAELMFGYFYEATEDLMIKSSFGVTFADIEQKNNSILDNIGSPGDAFAHIKSTFVGAGPKAQVDGLFELSDYFAIVGNLGLGLLLGESKVTNHITQQPPYSFDDYYEDSEQRVALEVDSKLGVLYDQEIDNETYINIEAGYKFVTYLNALQDDPIQLLVSDNTLLFQADSDYYYSGPYVMLGIDFM